MINGYRAMLRDRLPFVVEQALKYLNVKTKWIEHVYDNFIKIYKDKHDRYEATRIALGLSKKYREFDFKKTIAWENLSKEEQDKWTAVQKWVEWFMRYYQYIKNDYNVVVKTGGSMVYFKLSIMRKYKIDEKLFRYLIKCFHKENEEPC